jgi:cell division septation protein DedD
VWVIQVHALRNRDAASAIVKRLIAKGYPAFLPNPPKGEPSIYRVQIGRYKDRAEAEQVARRLAREEQLRPEIKR